MHIVGTFDLQTTWWIIPQHLEPWPRDQRAARHRASPPRRAPPWLLERRAALPDHRVLLQRQPQGLPERPAKRCLLGAGRGLSVAQLRLSSCERDGLRGIEAGECALKLTGVSTFKHTTGKLWYRSSNQEVA